MVQSTLASIIRSLVIYLKSLSIHLSLFIHKIAIQFCHITEEIPNVFICFFTWPNSYRDLCFVLTSTYSSCCFEASHKTSQSRIFRRKIMFLDNQFYQKAYHRFNRSHFLIYIPTNVQPFSKRISALKPNKFTISFHEITS
jgi:hypothetical protein